MNQPNTDLEKLINGVDPNKEDEPTESTDDGIIEFIGNAISQIQDSVASMHIAIRTLATRMASIERHVSYLLEQDPVAGPKIKEHLAKLDAENRERQDAEIAEANAAKNAENTTSEADGK